MFRHIILLIFILGASLGLTPIAPIDFEADHIDLAQSDIIKIKTDSTDILPAIKSEFIAFEMDDLQQSDVLEKIDIDIIKSVSIDSQYLELENIVDNVTVASEYSLQVEAETVDSASEYSLQVEAETVDSARNLELETSDTIETILLAEKDFGISTVLHPLFRRNHPELWEEELKPFQAGSVVSFEPFDIPENFYAISPHINAIHNSMERTKILLEEKKADGVNAIVVPYRVGYDPNPSIEFAAWANQKFDIVILGFSANLPWPKPKELQEILQDLFAEVDAVITSWVSSIDVAGVFASYQEDTSRFETWELMTRWVDNEAKMNNIPVWGFRKIDVHGTWENPSRAGGKSGGVFDYTPEGMAAYVYAHIHPFEAGVMVPSEQIIKNRINHQYEGVPFVLGPFYYFGDIGEKYYSIEQFRRIVNLYRSLGYKKIKKWVNLP